jgi:glycosyltransferase involved in cell wall biosynthesis
VAKQPEHVQLEIPRFGEFARQYANISSSTVASCLELQRRTGGRLGAIMVQQGHLGADQVKEILRRQATWAARTRSHDIAPLEFPLSRPLSLCFPCYNEQDVIGDVLAGALAVLPEFLEEFEIVVVDDGSKDDTSAVVERVAMRDDRVRLVRHEKNRGYGAAVSTALRSAHGEWICFTDGDGQFNMLDLPNLLAHADKSDVVIGYRRRRAEGGVRKFNANSWKWLIRCLVGLKVRDLDCAFKLFPRWVIDCLKLSSEGACISAEIMAQCMRGGVSITEVPVNHYPRSAGKATGANIKVVLKAFRELPIIWQYRKMAPWTVDRRLNDVAASAWASRRKRSAKVAPSIVTESLGTEMPLTSLGER